VETVFLKAHPKRSVSVAALKILELIMALLGKTFARALYLEAILLYAKRVTSQQTMIRLSKLQLY
jgi:hypothetical protein